MASRLGQRPSNQSQTAQLLHYPILTLSKIHCAVGTLPATCVPCPCESSLKLRCGSSATMFMPPTTFRSGWLLSTPGVQPIRCRARGHLQQSAKLLLQRAQESGIVQSQPKVSYYNKGWRGVLASKSVCVMLCNCVSQLCTCGVHQACMGYLSMPNKRPTDKLASSAPWCGPGM